MRRSTQVNIARTASVSRATVSGVIKGWANSHITISFEIKQRVMDAVTELGYVPKNQAQALHSGSFNTIGSFAPDIHSSHFWQQQYVEETDLAAQGLGYRLLASSASLEPTQKQENRTSSC